MRKKWSVLFAVFFCFLLSGCGKSLDMSTLIPSPAKEVVIYASGREVRVNDQESINSVVEVIRKTVFKPTRTLSINDPGATTITIDVIMEQGKVTITYPCFQYDSWVYDAGADSVQIFYDYIGQ